MQVFTKKNKGDQISAERKTGVGYDITCNKSKKYNIGEMALDKTLNEHQKQTSAVNADWERVKAHLQGVDGFV